jgi:hypothetical protein
VTSCYGIRTAPIVRFAAVMHELREREVVELEPEGIAAFATKNRRILEEIEKRFLEAFSTFLQILYSIARARLRFPRQEKVQGFREFRLPFLRIYDRAARRSLALLAQVLAEAFEQDPTLRVAFASELASSMVAAEMATYVDVVSKPSSAAEADSHAGAAIEIVDSIKDLVKSFVSRIPVVKKLKKKSVERGLHVINEVAKIVFPGH